MPLAGLESILKPYLHVSIFDSHRLEIFFAFFKKIRAFVTKQQQQQVVKVLFEKFALIIIIINIDVSFFICIQSLIKHWDF